MPEFIFPVRCKTLCWPRLRAFIDPCLSGYVSWFFAAAVAVAEADPWQRHARKWLIKDTKICLFALPVRSQERRGSDLPQPLRSQPRLLQCRLRHPRGGSKRSLIFVVSCRRCETIFIETCVRAVTSNRGYTITRANNSSMPSINQLINQSIDWYILCTSCAIRS